MTGEQALTAIKVVHTVVWAFFAGCIVAIPVCTWRARLRVAWWLSAVVMLECAVLALNHMRCPLTDLALRYAPETRANFDIYLPEWLARWNKTIFGGVFAAAEAWLAVRWARRRR